MGEATKQQKKRFRACILYKTFRAKSLKDMGSSTLSFFPNRGRNRRLRQKHTARTFVAADTLQGFPTAPRLDLFDVAKVIIRIV